MSNRNFYLLCLAWVILALSTLYLVVENNDALAAAFVAWTGGLITLALYQQIRARVAQR